MLNRILVIFFILVIATPLMSEAFGHGLSIDTPPPVNYNGRDIAISAEMLPPFYDLDADKQIRIRAFDSKTNEDIKNVNFLISLNYKDEMIFRNYFFTADGNLAINVHTSNDKDIKITGEKEQLLGGWMATSSKPIELTGPVFNSGGLYHLEIEIRTIDEPDNMLDKPIKYDAYISIGQTSYHEQKSKDGNDVKFRVKSYYDTITNFEYNSTENSISFEMPFDWNEQNISQIPYIHEEVLFPKDFVDFLTPSYSAQVNGIDLFKSSISIDDYSEDGRVVHLVALQDHLRVLREAQKKNGELPNFMQFKITASQQAQFPLTAITDNQQFQIDLSWDPITIQPGEKTKFIFTIRDATTLDTIQHSTYDFIILHNGREIHRASGNAVVGGGFEDYTFAEDQTGPTTVRFEKIAGTAASTQFSIVVVPEFGSYIALIFVIAISIVIILRIFPHQINYMN